MKTNREFFSLPTVGLILVFFLSGILPACKTSKTTETTDTTLEKISREERLDRILSSEIHYNTLLSNLSFTVKDKSVDAQLRIRKDEAIQLSFRIPLLGEMFKVVISPEELIVVDRFNKQYMQEPMRNIKNQMPVDFDFYSLQSMLSNQLFMAGKKRITSDDIPSFRITENDYLVHISHTDRQNIEYNFVSNYTDRIQQMQITHPGSQARLLCEYTDWGKTSDQKDFPMTMKILLSSAEKKQQMKMEFRSVDINSNLKIDQTVPKKYKRVSIQQVTNLLKQLL